MIELRQMNAGEVTLGPRAFAIATSATHPDGTFGMTIDPIVVFCAGLLL